MAQQVINRGSAAGDGTGESPYDGFGKVNDNFTELYGAGAGLGSSATTQLLYNLAGVITGDSGLTWDATNKSLTAGGGTVTTSNPVLNLAQTWNAGGVTFTADKLNVTNTASASGSLLIDRQVGGVSKFSVNKAGVLTLPVGSAGAPSYVFSGFPTYGIYFDASSGIVMAHDATAAWGTRSEGITLPNTKAVVWTSGVISAGIDLVLSRDAANTLALRNSTNAQTFRAYSTYTDGSNGSWAEILSLDGANKILITSRANGTGTVRDLWFGTSSSRRLGIIDGTGNIEFNTNFLATTDASYDIGSSSKRARDIYASRDIYTAGGTQAIMRTSAAITSGAGASAGTLTNAPAVGNPTCWIPINDNGTVRYLPAW